MLGIKYPIISAPMGPFFTKELATVVSAAGGLGVLSHAYLIGQDPIKLMKDSMLYVVEHTDKPFGLNIRTSRVQPDAQQMVSEIPKLILSNQKLKEQCRFILTSAGSSKTLQKSKRFQELKSVSQIKHFHVAPSPVLAQKCVDAGCDGIIVTGYEGGGHQSYEGVSSLVLLQQMQKKFPDLPKIAAGGFATGESLVAALSLGAGAIAMGSRFIASKECEFRQEYKDIIPPADSSDTQVITGLFGPIRLWKNTYTAKHGLVANKSAKMEEEQNVTAEQLLDEQRHYEMVYTGNITDGAVPLGQSIGIIKSIESVGTIIETVMKEAEAAISRIKKLAQ